jgi:hypothetical protein
MKVIFLCFQTEELLEELNSHLALKCALRLFYCIPFALHNMRGMCYFVWSILYVYWSQF